MKYPCSVNANFWYMVKVMVILTVSLKWNIWHSGTEQPVLLSVEIPNIVLLKQFFWKIYFSSQSLIQVTVIAPFNSCYSSFITWMPMIWRDLKYHTNSFIAVSLWKCYDHVLQDVWTRIVNILLLCKSRIKLAAMLIVMLDIS